MWGNRPAPSHIVLGMQSSSITPICVRAGSAKQPGLVFFPGAAACQGQLDWHSLRGWYEGVREGRMSAGVGVASAFSHAPHRESLRGSVGGNERAKFVF